jgi:hypothetical protein
VGKDIAEKHAGGARQHSVEAAPTEDPVKSMETIAHLVKLQALPLHATGSERHTAGRATGPSGCDRYIYSGSQRVSAMLQQPFSV